MEDRMNHTINNEGLHRLVAHELKRMHPTSRKEAYDTMIGRMGVYDRQGEVIEEGVRAYFDGAASAI
ncbi:hypothetical protein SAMN04488071_0866 [Kordiimonas lacus]|jgi:hypothetical protein|uniref:Uncharacterized protein n=2 Tax=Kordiimonadaceae TaxID=1331809 RepID=A0A1G6VVI6_9PROT|nr:hypothetical protein SAMN04488071_0866 [Kordiimonas lacus]